MMSDRTNVKVSVGAQAAHEGQDLLKWLTGSSDIAQAVSLAIGRPGLADTDRERSVTVHARFAQSSVRRMDDRVRQLHMDNRSEYLRLLVERDLHHDDHQVQNV